MCYLDIPKLAFMGILQWHLHYTSLIFAKNIPWTFLFTQALLHFSPPAPPPEIFSPCSRRQSFFRYDQILVLSKLTHNRSLRPTFCVLPIALTCLQHFSQEKSPPGQYICKKLTHKNLVSWFSKLSPYFEILSLNITNMIGNKGSVIIVLFNTKMALQLKHQQDVKIRISVSISSLYIRLWSEMFSLSTKKV